MNVIPNDNVDLTNCDREPIQYLGRIQSQGFLLSVGRDWVVRHASANMPDLCGAEAGAMIGRPITDWITRTARHRFGGQLQLIAGGGVVERLWAVDVFGEGRLFDVALHASEENLILEFEPCGSAESRSMGGHVRAMIERIKRETTIADMLKSACRCMKAMTGFDRVMVYRFLPDGAGEVVAEEAAPDMEPYFGLRYPASDIPQQARELYRRNLIRIICDVDDPTVPIIGEDGPAADDLDLSHSVFRAVSTIHLEYLRNMGVQASMSASILRGEDLWGLFACHHDAPAALPLERRGAIELFTELFGHILAAREQQELQQQVEEAVRSQSALLEAVHGIGAAQEKANEVLAHLERMIAADGVAMSVNGHLRTSGLTPDPAVLERLATFIAARSPAEIFVSEHLAADWPEGNDIADTAAGVLAVPLAESDMGYVMFLRRPVDQIVRWAGDPTKPVAADGERLTPRKSFSIWQETVRGHSESWTEAEVATAGRLRVVLYEIALQMRRAVNEERERHRAHQDILIAELNHRVRNILNLIRGLLAQTGNGAESVEEFAGIVGGRIDAMALAHDQLTRRRWEDISLETLLSTEIRAFQPEGDERISLAGPYVELTPRAFSSLALVVHELLTNAQKHGALSATPGRVTVDWRTGDEGLLEIDWRESGGPVPDDSGHRGFGSTIIERLIPFELGGRAEVGFSAEGLAARFMLPPAQFRYGEAPARPVTPAPAPRAPQPAAVGPETAADSRIVVAEDNLIIAMEFESLLRDAGFGDVEIVNDAKNALRAAESRPDLAVLDINLGDETTLSAARRLNEMGVPIVFVSGYGDAGTDEVHRLAFALLTKPVRAEKLVETVRRALSAAQRP